MWITFFKSENYIRQLSSKILKKQQTPNSEKLKSQLTCKIFADILESWPIEILNRVDPSAFVLSDNHNANAAAIATATGSVEL